MHGQAACQIVPCAVWFYVIIDVVNAIIGVMRVTIGVMGLTLGLMRMKRSISNSL